MEKKRFFNIFLLDAGIQTTASVSGDEYLENPELAGRLIGVLHDGVDENDKEVKTGDVGEIAIKSSQYACYSTKEETDEVPIDTMHTGDLAL